MKVEFDQKIYQFEGKKKVKEILRELGLNPQAVLVIRGDELLTEDILLSSDEEIKILRVMSGGEH